MSGQFGRPKAYIRALLVGTAILPLAAGAIVSAAASASAPAPGTITTVAGTANVRKYTGDNGPATQATLNQPEDVAVAVNGDAYIADYGNCVVRKVAAATGIITTVAGNGTCGYTGDNGPATKAELDQPNSVDLDASGNLYIADSYNNVIREVDTAGIITTFAGNGTKGYTGDNGPATKAELAYPYTVRVGLDGGVYIADEENYAVREVLPSGIITTVAGNGIKSLSPTAGNGGPATQAEFYDPVALCLDRSGDLFIADEAANTVREVTPDGVIHPFAGDGVNGTTGVGGPATSGELSGPYGCGVDPSGNVYIGNYASNNVEVVSPDGVLHMFAGTNVKGETGDGGPATAAETYGPSGVYVDRTGNVWFADYTANTIREVTAPHPTGAGYWLVASDGGIFNYGDAKFYGSAGAHPLNKPVVGIASTPDGKGYWLVASDGGIFNYGDAHFYGSAGAHPLNQPVVGIASTPDGKGYWLVASDGGIFNYGDAKFYGSAGAHPLNKPVVGIASTPDGKGYWLVASDGGIFNYGDAKFYGSAGAHPLNKPVVGIASTPDGKGYWLTASDGGIFNYGDALFYGSAGAHPLNKPVVGIAATPDGKGYWLTASDGGIFNYGDALFYGSAGAHPLNQPILGVAAGQ